jgi:hypothetical protein
METGIKRKRSSGWHAQLKWIEGLDAEETDMMRSVAVVFLLVSAVASAPAAQSAPAPQIDSIRQSELRADLFFLASDAMQGRLTNTPTNGLAADWVRSRYERLGLKPGGQNGSFEHRYALMTAALGDGNEMAIGATGAGGTRTNLRPGQDFYPHRFSASAAAEGRLVFAGFGIVSAERGHDD